MSALIFLLILTSCGVDFSSIAYILPKLDCNIFTCS